MIGKYFLIHEIPTGPFRHAMTPSVPALIRLLQTEKDACQDSLLPIILSPFYYILNRYHPLLKLYLAHVSHSKSLPVILKHCSIIKDSRAKHAPCLILTRDTALHRLQESSTMPPEKQISCMSNRWSGSFGVYLQ